MSYNFVADESVQFGVISALRNSGYSIYSISESNSSISDSEVLEISNNFSCVLITEDKDFGELSFRLGQSNYGILLLRLHDIIPSKRSELVV